MNAPGAKQWMLKLTERDTDTDLHAAVPFEEDNKDATIWFMDHSYMENMSRMFRKVNGALDRARVLYNVQQAAGCWLSSFCILVRLL